LRRTAVYASFLKISGAMHLDIFDQPPVVLLVENLRNRYVKHRVLCALSV
jgi:hypothetical protein